MSALGDFIDEGLGWADRVVGIYGDYQDIMNPAKPPKTIIVNPPAPAGSGADQVGMAGIGNLTMAQAVPLAVVALLIVLMARKG